MATPAVSARVRHYVTLAPSFVLFFTFAFFAVEKPTVGLITVGLFWGAGFVGPMLELLGKPVGRSITLWVSGLQAATILGIFSYIAYASRGDVTIQLFDIPGLLIVLLPSVLFVWNYRAGKSSATRSAAS